VQTLPEFGMTVPHYRLDNSPFYSRTELLATNFSRDNGDDGQRLFLRQGVGMVLRPGSWLELTPEVALYGRYYHVDAGDESDLLPEYSATLSTRLVRNFPFERWGVERLQHSIEPEVRYVYMPDSDQDELPFFTLDDRLGPLNQVEYALVNRLTARVPAADGAPVYREVLNLRLSQAYDVREARDSAGDDVGPFSDLRAELVLRPSESSFLSIDALTRVYDDLQFSRFSAGGGFDDSRGNVARIDYYYRNAHAPVRLPGNLYRTVDITAGATDFMQVALATARFDPVHLSISERYDFRENDALETVLGIEYRARCWSLFLTYRDRPDDQEFLIGFALSGLGRVGGFGSAWQPQGAF
jgi:LPS-assembly protein